MNPQAAAQPVHTEPTPNPNTLKFNVHQVLLASGSADFPTKEAAQVSPLAAKLFQIPGVAGVFLGRDFVTITKSGGGDWQGVVPTVIQTIQHQLASGEPVITQTQAGAATAATGSDVEQKIREIIDREVRPAVAMDGGDIIFMGYQNGIVKLHLQGSCHGCPSSLMTLKMGIEQRLRRTVPEVVAVEAV